MPQSFDLNCNHFELFGVAPAFNLDLAALERAYRELQAQVHPDRFAHLPAAEQRAAMQWSTHVNGAYQALKSPLERAKYMIILAGGETGGRQSAELTPEFLAEQMEWREAVETARERGDAGALSTLDRDTLAATATLHAELGQTLDVERDHDAARAILFRLMFLDKLHRDIGDAVEAIATT